MINEQTIVTLESLGLMLARIDFSSSSRVCVGVRDKTGNRWLGHAETTPHDPVEGLQKAFEDSLRQFNPNWKELLEKSAHQ